MLIQWLKDITLNVVLAVDKDENVEQCDIEIKALTFDEIDIVDDRDIDTEVDMQFGDGSMAFGVSKDFYKEIEK